MSREGREETLQLSHGGTRRVPPNDPVRARKLARVNSEHRIHSFETSIVREKAGLFFVCLLIF